MSGRLVAAIYARKSTEQKRAKEELSVTQQEEGARAFAAKRGWSVSDAHVYVDDGISGAEFKKRPGLQRMMQALEPRAPFQVLIVREISRLGREAVTGSRSASDLPHALQGGALRSAR